MKKLHVLIITVLVMWALSILCYFYVPNKVICGACGLMSLFLIGSFLYESRQYYGLTDGMIFTRGNINIKVKTVEREGIKYLKFGRLYLKRVEYNENSGNVSYVAYDTRSTKKLIRCGAVLYNVNQNRLVDSKQLIWKGSVSNEELNRRNTFGIKTERKNGFRNPKS